MSSKPDAQAKATKRWAVAMARRHESVAPLTLVAAVANRVATSLATRWEAPQPGRSNAPPSLGAAFGPVPDLGHDDPEPPTGWAEPWLVGAVHEQAASAADRQARGAFYTPRPVVEGLVGLATADGVVPELVVDPTCGGGGFLLAALDRLVALGLSPSEAVGRVAGMDVDADAVEVSRWSVRLWLAARLGRAHMNLGEEVIDVIHGDALTDAPARWLSRLLVVGNPPFASPLKAGRVPPTAAAYRAERTELLGPYADIAASHLLRAVELAAPGSTIALVQPQSILSSRDTHALRAHLEQVAPLRSLWAAREAVFDAGIRACAPILDVGGKPGDDVGLYFGPDVQRRAARPRQSWGCLGADALGAPELPMMGGRLGELVSATAGFRDEHYGLVAACREQLASTDRGGGPRSGFDPPADGLADRIDDRIDDERDGRIVDEDIEARVVTVGSVDPLTISWGLEPFRFGGQDWERPVVDRSGLPVKIRGWFDRQRRPKVLLATQSKLLEPFVDRTGQVIPATPLIAVHADPENLDRVAAVLLAPPVVVWAWRQWFGSALAVDAVKLAARQVADLPLPTDELAWDEAAALVASADDCRPGEAWDIAVSVASVMTRAYGCSEEVFNWWYERLKPRPQSS